MTETENNKQDEKNEQPKYYVELVDQILTELEGFFSSHLDDVFQKTDDYLFKAADEATSTAEQNGLFECMNAVRENKSLIQQGFVDELSSYLQPMSELDILPEKKASKKNAELGLIEQNEMDEMVTLTSISSKAAMDNSELINNLIVRFEELGKYNDDIFHAEAVEPKRLCDAMHEAVSATDLIDGNKLVVYKFFDSALVKNINKLYEALNNLLIEQGILPVIDYRGAVPHYEEPAYEETPDGDISAEQSPNTQSTAAPAAQGRRAFGSGMSGYSGAVPQAPLQQSAIPPQGMMPQQGAPQGQAMPMGMNQGVGPRRAFGSGMQNYMQAQQAGQQQTQPTDGSATGPSGQALSAGVPVAQVRQSIESFIGGAVANGGMPAGENYYSQQQVMTALTSLQAPSGEISQTPLIFDANQIKKALLSNIGEADGGIVSKAVNQVSEKTIDFIKLIFDGIIEEESITDEIKTLLLSLQIPVIKAAMLDADFFVDDQHPARQLLDKIAEAGVGVSEHKDPVYVEIVKVVRALLNNYDEDVIAFSIALDDLNALTEDIYSKARKTEAKSQKTLKMTHAKKMVLQEIRKITIGKELPEGVRTLVLKVWPSMMFNHFLQNGKGNDEWVELLMILQKVIESIQPLHSTEELNELGLSYAEIVKGVRTKLEKCKKSQKTVDRVLDELEETYDNLMSTNNLPNEDDPKIDITLVANANNDMEASAIESSSTDVAAHNDSEDDSEDDSDNDSLEIDDEPALELPVEDVQTEDAQVDSAKEEEEEDPEIVSRRKIGLLPDGVAPGSWFIVYNGEDRPVRRLKLAVILVHDACMVFVDHLGNVVIEKDAGIFADEIDRGLSGIIMQHSVFDHALHSALKAIEH